MRGLSWHAKRQPVGGRIAVWGLFCFFWLGFSAAQSAWAQNPPVARLTGDNGLSNASPMPRDRSPGKFFIPGNDNAPDSRILTSNSGAGHEVACRWSSTFDLTSTVGCTGTLIGPQVMLTAAHCIHRTPRIELRFTPASGFEEVGIIAHCQPHPIFRPQGYFSQFDFGLCYLETRFADRVWMPSEGEIRGTCADDPPNAELERLERRRVRFERLSLDVRKVKPRKRLLLSGFGCFSFNISTIDHHLRAGIAAVGLVADLYITLGGKFGRESGILCPGDSGGAAYVFRTTDPYGPREIVGVNSASLLAQGTSFIARTSSPAFVQFLRVWRSRWRNPMICGLDPDAADECHH